MYLNIILTVFVVLQIITLTMAYKWWKKYGKKIFTSFTDMKNSFATKINTSNNGETPPNPFLLIQNVSQLLKQFENSPNKK